MHVSCGNTEGEVPSQALSPTQYTAIGLAVGLTEGVDDGLAEGVDVGLAVVGLAVRSRPQTEL